MTRGHESKICNSSPIRTAGEGGSALHEMHMRGVERVSPVDQSLVRLVSDPSPWARIRRPAAWPRLCSVSSTDEHRSRGPVSR